LQAKNSLIEVLEAQLNTETDAKNQLAAEVTSLKISQTESATRITNMQTNLDTLQKTVENLSSVKQ
jgi:hypothetical protein